MNDETNATGAAARCGERRRFGCNPRYVHVWNASNLTYSLQHNQKKKISPSSNRCFLRLSKYISLTNLSILKSFLTRCRTLETLRIIPKLSAFNSCMQLTWFSIIFNGTVPIFWLWWFLISFSLCRLLAEPSPGCSRYNAETM